MNILHPRKVLCPLFFTLSFIVTANAQVLDAPFASDCSPDEIGQTRREVMEERLNDYLQLSEEALSMRFAAIAFREELEVRKARREALSGQDFLRVNQGAENMVAQRERLLKTAIRHECWLAVPLPADPEQAAIYRAGILLSLSSALVLYDNYMQALLPYRNDPELRRYIKRGDKGFYWTSGKLHESELMFSSLENRGRVRRAIDWYLAGNALSSDAESSPHRFAAEAYLRESIAQSPAFHLVRQHRNPLRIMRDLVRFIGTLTTDSVAHLGEESFNFSSQLFGNTMGLVETRRGKLDQRPDVRADLEQALRAGDILLEKTPFRLTDNFIPGHWGHAAVWVGSKTELQALGIWDHPLVKARQAEIEAGKGVVEALRSGVKMNTPAHFLNVDDVAVLRLDRPEALDRKARVEIILQTLRQVDKPYDFNFDVESSGRMFCSKLVYHSYARVNWPTSRMLGRFTISPDDIAQRSLADGPLSVALLYHDGRKIDENAPAVMASLINTAGAKHR
ncbi:hypothetical protein AGMMS50256_15790 [Betaproteobacteria bacterium]|nr:hypothetical protein AGMMS50256_15790 [Betaproteobacteria bacterium]